MLNLKIRQYRKQKGYSQETLAQELNVVRQTVSKWEKGYSVPDAVMLERLAEVFEVSVGDLLGIDEEKAEEKTGFREVSEQLSILNNQIAKELGRKRRNRKIALTAFLSIVILIVVFLFGVVFMRFDPQIHYVTSEESISHCNIDKELDSAVSKAIMDTSSDGYNGEFKTESHMIYDFEEKGEKTTVYLWADVSSFGFLDGFFTEVGGGSNPLVLTFKKGETGFELVEHQEPEDGSHYGSSIKKMFPRRLEKNALNGPNAREREVMWNNQVLQALNYLSSINRSATVCKYSDIEYHPLSSYGVSTEVENKLLIRDFESNLGVGNHETIEEGTRYVYQTDFDQSNDWITYTKFEFDTNKIVKFIAVNAATGEKVEDAKPPKKAVFKRGKLKSPSGNYEPTTLAYYID